nr:unnamed protein product [Callosobruchus chinensis]
MAFLDQKEITHFLAQELFYQQVSEYRLFCCTILTEFFCLFQFITFEGLNSGVPTRTTPTLTPTTLRNIEQTFIELQSKSHENEAGFYISTGDTVDNSVTNDASSYPSKPSSLWHGSSLSQSSSDCDTRSTPPLPTGAGQGAAPTKAAPSQRRNMGGRKPAKDVNCSPEEEERRRIRRERNKAAAARCRKRRVDHTNALIAETEELERKKQDLQDELQQLRQLKDQLEYILDAHQTDCRMQDRSPPDVKPFNNNIYADDKFDQDDDERVKTELVEPINDIFLSPSPSKRLMLSGAAPVCRPNRPSTLNVATAVPKTVSEVIGGPLTTPSTGMMFNFESLMGGGTGLTPVNAPLAPSSCGTQQRNHVPVSMADLSSPDAGGPPKLVSL